MIITLVPNNGFGSWLVYDELTDVIITVKTNESPETIEKRSRKMIWYTGRVKKNHNAVGISFELLLKNVHSNLYFAEN